MDEHICEDCMECFRTVELVCPNCKGKNVVLVEPFADQYDFEDEPVLEDELGEWY